MPDVLTRRPDWHARLVGAIEEVRRTPFAWGIHDCGVGWAGRAVEAVTGVDVAAPYRAANYKSARGALSVIRRAGFADLGALLAHHFPEMHPSRAQLGDLAAIKTETGVGYGIGVVNGDTVLVLGEDGVRITGLLEVDRAYAVGWRP